MNRLLNIQESLRDTSAAIARTERAFSDSPVSPSVVATLKSFEKRKRVLEDELKRESEKIGVDICSYRFFAAHVRATVTPLCSSLVEFQHLFSTAYDAIKTGAKKRFRRLNADVLDESSFFFGYTFDGSVGVVLTYDNHKIELFESSLDESMGAVFDLARARTTDQVLERGKKLGVPGVRAMHRWAASHVESALGAEIEWRRGYDVKDQIMLEISDMKQLLAAIDNTTEIIEEDIQLEAKLAGADVDRRTFHLQLEDREIRGTFSQFISETQTFEVGRIYNVTIRRQVKVYYSTDQEEDVSFKLLLARPK